MFLLFKKAIRNSRMFSALSGWVDPPSPKWAFHVCCACLKIRGPSGSPDVNRKACCTSMCFGPPWCHSRQNCELLEGACALPDNHKILVSLLMHTLCASCQVACRKHWSAEGEIWDLDSVTFFHAWVLFTLTLPSSSWINTCSGLQACLAEPVPLPTLKIIAFLHSLHSYPSTHPPWAQSFNSRALNSRSACLPTHLALM